MKTRTVTVELNRLRHEFEDYVERHIHHGIWYSKQDLQDYLLMKPDVLSEFLKVDGILINHKDKITTQKLYKKHTSYFDRFFNFISDRII